MCLSTVYRNEKADSNVLCQYVAHIAIEGDKIILTDVLGAKTEIVGKLLTADLTAGTVIVAQ
jgi:predicted RNA-binding protein